MTSAASGKTGQVVISPDVSRSEHLASGFRQNYLAQRQALACLTDTCSSQGATSLCLPTTLIFCNRGLRKSRNPGRHESFHLSSEF